MRTGLFCLLSLLLAFQQFGLGFCSAHCACEQIANARLTHSQLSLQTSQVSGNNTTRVPSRKHDSDCVLEQYCQVLASEKVVPQGFSVRVVPNLLYTSNALQVLIPEDVAPSGKLVKERTFYLKVPRYLYLHQIRVNQIS